MTTRCFVLFCSLLVALGLAGCRDAGQSALKAGTTASGDADPNLGAGGPRPGALAPPPEAPPKVSWPAGWRLLDEGRFGADQLSVAWYHLDAGQQPADESVAAALAALRAVVGRLEFEDLSQATRQRQAIGQIRGSLAWGSVEASGEGEATRVVVLLEARPGI